MSWEYVLTDEEDMWLNIRDKFVEAFDSEDWEEAYKSADEWLAAHDARIASEAAEKALRDHRSRVVRFMPPGLVDRASVLADLDDYADRIAAERKGET